jgi:LysM repeat protein
MTPRRMLASPLLALLTLAAVLTAGASSTIRIKAGDTLWELAQRHHTTIDVLSRLNDLPGSGTIYAGELLRVPRATPPRPHVVEKGYTVRPGDNLSTIARRYGVSVLTISMRNRLPHSGLVMVGRRLAIPVRVTGAGPSRSAQRHLTTHRNSATYNAGLRIPTRVQRSAARHRDYLSRHRQPSQASVRRLVYRTARRIGVDPSLVLAVAYNESGFQQRVVSPVDAIGVMQVLPSTGRVLGQSYGRRLNLLRAEDNVLAGALLLKQLVRATGRADLALAGYYQGLGSVHTIGMLPQTHTYIRTVTALRARFRRG